MRSRIIYANPLRYEIEGVEVTEEEFRTRTTICGITPGQPPRGHTASCWPMKSDALAVHPSQIAAVMERNKRHGITGVSYEPDGRPVLADRGARRDLMRLEGLHDNNGGYGDDHALPSPQDPLPDSATGGEMIDLQDLE